MINLFSFLKSKSNSSTILNIDKFSLEISSDMQWCFEGGDYYEKNVIHFINIIIKNSVNTIFYDIGANCGFYSIKYASECKHVYSFEPTSQTFNFLKRNIERNKISNISAFSFGLADSNSSHVINVYNSSGNNSIFNRKIPNNHSLKKIGTEKIELKKLDDLFNNGLLETPTIIKIDVEGAELHVLKGAQEIIQKCRPIIVIEYADTTSNDAGYNKEDILTILKLTNYRYYGIHEDVNNFNLIKQSVFNVTPIANIIFIPKEKDIFFDDNN